LEKPLQIYLKIASNYWNNYCFPLERERTRTKGHLK